MICVGWGGGGGSEKLARLCKRSPVPETLPYAINSSLFVRLWRNIRFTYVIRTNKMHTFSINDLIQLYCLRHVSNNQVFILWKTCTSSFMVFLMLKL